MLSGVELIRLSSLAAAETRFLGICFSSDVRHSYKKKNPTFNHVCRLPEDVRPVQTRRWRHNPQETGHVGLEKSGDCLTGNKCPILCKSSKKRGAASTNAFVKI